jgi:uncharacterized protein YdcH (DUF465 family)
LTGPGGVQLPAAFDVKQAMAYLQKQNPDADPQTLFAALGQMGGMWEQLHPQAKQDYQLLRDNLKFQMQMDMLKERLDATDRQLKERSDLQHIRDMFLEAGRNSRFEEGESGKDSRQQNRERGVESRFERREQGRTDRATSTARIKDLTDQKTEVKDQITKLNRERAEIKGKYAFGQTPQNSEDFKALQQKAAEIDQLSDKTVQIDRQIRTVRSGGGGAKTAAPKETPEADQSSGPEKGDVEGGYEFQGGDPADQKNWKQVKEWENRKPVKE